MPSESLIDSAFVKEAARAVGFHKVGIARARPLDPGPLDRVLAIGAEADMSWLATQRALRLDPALLLPEVKSVIALALGHARGDPLEVESRARVARYAQGRDYHAVMKRKLARLSAALRERDPDVRLFASADVAPVMEKVWAEQAGVGWVGKNGCLVTPDMGSWVVLATLLVDRELIADAPHPRRCGSCAACVPACPANAILEPGLVDARRCISFQTIERRGPIPETVAETNREWIFGCDACQAVCPWNLQPSTSGAPVDPELASRPGQARLDIDEMLRLTLPEYQRRFYGTALARARYEGLVRNAVLAAGQSGEARYVEPVRALLESPFPGVAAAARWAEARLTGRGRG